MIARKLQTVGANGLSVDGYNVATGSPSTNTVPSGGEIGDLLIHLQIQVDLNTSPPLAPPTGFTTIVSTTATSTYKYRLTLSYLVTTSDKSGDSVVSGTDSIGALLVVIKNADGISSILADGILDEYSVNAIGSKQIDLSTATAPLIAVATFSQFLSGTTASNSGRTVAVGPDPVFSLRDPTKLEEIYIWLYDGDPPVSSISPSIGDGGLVNMIQVCYLEVTV